MPEFDISDMDINKIKIKDKIDFKDDTLELQ